MSSVTPTDNGYNYYQKKLSQDEEEIKAEAKRNEEGRTQEARSTEERYKKGLEKNEAVMQGEAERINKKANENVQNSRENARRDVDRNRAETYDKMGRFIQDKTKETTDKKNEYERAEETLKARYGKTSSDTDNAYGQKLREREVEFNDRLSTSVKEARDSANDSYKDVIQKKDDESRNELKSARDTYGKLEAARIADTNNDRRTQQRNVSELEHNFKMSENHDEKTLLERFDKADRANATKTEETVERQNESRRQETDHYQSQVKDLLSAEKVYMKEKGQGRSDSIREHDDDARAREFAQNDTYNRQNALSQKTLRAQEEHSSAKTAEMLRDQASYLTGVLKGQKSENQQNLKDLESEFKLDHEQMEKQNKHQVEISSASNNVNNEKQAELRANELRHQGETSRSEMKDVRNLANQKNMALEKQLNERATTDDVALISPSAENAVRTSVAKQYEKNFQMERETNQKTLDHMNEGFGEKLTDVIQTKDMQRTQAYNEQLSARHSDSQRFQDYVAETTSERDNVIKNADAERSRSGLNATRIYSNSLNRQKQEYDEIFAGQKLDSGAKMQSVREESDFNLKMAARNSAAHEQDLIRNYENKISDMRADSSAQIEDLKGQIQIQARDLDRKSKTELDTQARNYDQKLTQLEAQHKERERLVTANYQDELEKARRANALIIQKKS